MRHLTLFITFCLLFWLAASSPMTNRRLINRPTKEDMFGLRSRRYSDDYDVMGRSKMPARPQPLEYTVKKGEYVCDNRLCKLKTGEVPRGCKGICQYPIRIYPKH